jgi:hypothetical protein
MRDLVRSLPWLWIWLFVVFTGPAQADGTKTYRSAMNRLRSAEKRFWEEYDSSYRQALRVAILR